MRKKFIKTFLIALGSLVLGFILIVGGYVGYVSIQFYRIDDAQNLTSTIEDNQTSIVQVGETYTAVTYNIGFGAYTRDFSFFMDYGVMKDGTEVQGTNAKAESKDVVLQNTNGSISILEAIQADFLLLQEVDIKATRSHKVNQYQMIQQAFADFGSVFAYNFHSAFLFYPFHDPIGATDGGIATLSKYQMDEVIRNKLPIDEGFLNKFFDLDRCIMVSRLPVSNGKELVLINVHLSAYDEGGVYRALQLEVLKALMEIEYDLGNYVVIGGDFNHDIAGSLNLFSTEQEIPDWVFVLEEDQLPTGFRFATSNAHPTCRSTDMPYQPGVNYTVVIDGFIISDNIEIVEVENIISMNDQDMNFMYSDHNPVRLKFRIVE